MIEILSTGLPNSVQDAGRPGHLASGVSLAGAMDRHALALANALLGNDDGAAGLEIALFPFRLRFHVPAAFALAGAVCPARLDGRALPPAWTSVAAAGDTLTLEPPVRGGRAYLAFAGGIDVPLVLGSRSTDLKSGFGGHEGRGLKRGDRLALGGASPLAEAIRAPGFGAADPSPLPELGRLTRVRVLPAAEWDAFTDAARDAVLVTDWQLTADCNRQGFRLAGPALSLRQPLELFSHGILPGTVQVPPNGQPIVQMAEANTCGGYPKIAVVIAADLGLLAQTPAGGRVRFALCYRGEAVAALDRRRAGIARVRGAQPIANSGRP